MNKGFTPEELAIIQNKLPLPSDVFIDTIKDPTIANKILYKSGEMNKNLGRQKAHLSTTKTTKKKIKIK